MYNCNKVITDHFFHIHSLRIEPQSRSREKLPNYQLINVTINRIQQSREKQFVSKPEEMVKRISVECKMNRSWLLNPENDAAYKSQQKVLRYQCPYSIIEKSQGNGGNSCNQYCRDLGKGLLCKLHLLGHLRSLDNGNTKEDNRQRSEERRVGKEGRTGWWRED